MFLKISQISQENTCVGSLFNKAAGPQACNFIKKRLKHRWNGYSIEHLWIAASKRCVKMGLIFFFFRLSRLGKSDLNISLSPILVAKSIQFQWFSIAFLDPESQWSWLTHLITFVSFYTQREHQKTSLHLFFILSGGIKKKKYGKRGRRERESVPTKQWCDSLKIISMSNISADLYLMRLW